MLKRIAVVAIIAAAAFAGTARDAQAAPPGQVADWQRFYHYPYVYYPHAFQRPQEYDHLYYRHSPSMRIPVYNSDWYNFYPTEKPWHMGHHFTLDVF